MQDGIVGDNTPTDDNALPYDGSTPRIKSGEQFQSGDVIGRYRLEPPVLTNGGTSRVFKARLLAMDKLTVNDETKSKYFAVKILNFKQPPTQDHLSKIYHDEAESWIAVGGCAHMVPLVFAHVPGHLLPFPSSVEENAVYFVSEWNENGSLLNQIQKQKNNRFSEVEAVRFTHDMLRALEDAQAIARSRRIKKFSHGDIKLANALVFNDNVTGERYVKLTDFGTSRFFEGDAHKTATFQFTYPNSSPERIRNPENRTIADDLWAVNVSLWHMLTGKAPFAEYDTDGGTKNLNRQKTQQAINASESLDFPHEVPISEELKDVIRHAFQQDPAKRYTSPEEFLSALRNSCPNAIIESPRRLKFWEDNPPTAVHDSMPVLSAAQTNPAGLPALLTTEAFPEHIGFTKLQKGLIIVSFAAIVIFVVWRFVFK